MNEQMCYVNDGLVNPAMIPVVDPGKVTEAATALRDMGKAVKTEVTDFNTDWKALRGVYQAPEQETVYTLQDPAQKSAETIEEKLGKAASSLDTFASALAGIKPRLESLKAEVVTFRNSVIGGVTRYVTSGAFEHSISTTEKTVPWNEDSITLDRNEKYIGRINELVAEISAAETTCAEEINGLVDGMCIATGPALTKEQLNASKELPWGYARQYEPKNCPESVGYGVTDFVVGTVEGIGTLTLGYDPSTGEFFQGDMYAQSWSGLGNLAGSLVVTATGAGWVSNGMKLAGVENDFTRFMDDRQKVVATAAASIVNIDLAAEDPFHKWKDDPWRAGTSGVLNVASFFIPSAGAVGAGLKVGSTGSKVVRVAAALADMAVPGGSYLVKGLTSFTKVDGALGVVDDLARVGSKSPSVAGAVTGNVDSVVGGVTRAGDVRVPSMDDFARTTAKVEAPTTVGVPRVDAEVPVTRVTSDGSTRVVQHADGTTSTVEASTRQADAGVQSSQRVADGATIRAHSDGTVTVERSTAKTSVDADHTITETHKTKDTVQTSPENPGDAVVSEHPTKRNVVTEADTNGNVTVSNADGSTTVVDAKDRSITTTSRDGSTTTTTTADGVTTTERAGSTATTYPDGALSVKADGQPTVTTHPDGSASSVHADGTTVVGRPGEVTVSHADGSTTRVTADGAAGPVRHADGSVTSVAPDGSVQVRHADGTTTSVAPDGTLSRVDGEGRVTTTHTDGTVTITHPDGTSTKFVADGSSYGIDSHGVPEVRGDTRLGDGEYGSAQHAARENLSDTGLTENGRLVDPDVVPAQIQELVDRGVVRIDPDGTVRLTEAVQAHDFSVDNPTAEAHRQVGLQEYHTNQLTINELIENAMATRSKSPNATYLKEVLAQQMEAIRTAHPDWTPAQVKDAARAQFADQAALHGLDRAGGGYGDNFAGMGEGPVNSTLGANWTEGNVLRRNQAIRSALERAGIDRSLWGDIKVTVEYTINGKAW